MVGLFIISYFLQWGFGVFVLTQIATTIVNDLSKEKNYLKIVLSNLLVIIPAQFFYILKSPIGFDPNNRGFLWFAFILTFIFYINILISTLRHKVYIENKK